MRLIPERVDRSRRQSDIGGLDVPVNSPASGGGGVTRRPTATTTGVGERPGPFLYAKAVSHTSSEVRRSISRPTL
jgi:hypothetical protein